MQWILGAVIIAATTYLGFALKARGRRRVRQLEEIVQLLQHLDTKLCYLREKLVPIMNEIKADASPEFAGLLDAYIASIVSGKRSYAQLKSTLPRMQLEEGEFVPCSTDWDRATPTCRNARSGTLSSGLASTETEPKSNFASRAACIPSLASWAVCCSAFFCGKGEGKKGRCAA